MAKQKNINRKWQSLLQLLLLAGILIFINILANARLGGRALYAQLDMTEEGRFTLTKPTRELLADLDDVVFVRVLLEGEFPAGFKRLQKASREMLEDFRSESGFIEFEFEDPAAGSTEQINARRRELAKIGVIPTNLRLKDKEGTSERLIYPYAIFYYKGRQAAVNLLENEIPGVSPEVILNNSVGLLEYKFANAIQKLENDRKATILFTAGHGELTPLETEDLEESLEPFYNTGRIVLDSVVSIGEEAAALVVAKPRFPFSEKDKFKIDQYVMRGGKILWLIDAIDVNLDSLRGRRQFAPVDYQINLDDLLFKYGIRIEPNLVLDLQCSRIPLAVGSVGNAPQFDLFRYPYHLLVTPRSRHPVVRSLGAVNFFYASALDTAVQTKTGVRKTVLLTSSENSRLQYLPVTLDFEFLRYKLDPAKFNKPHQPVAMLLEGVFPSMYENRVTGEMLGGLEALGLDFLTQSVENKMIVVSDGDVAKNPVNPRNESYSPLGYNEFEKFQFANKDFITNALEYLLDERGVIEARGKEVRLRLLDTVKAQEEETRWRVLNILAPLTFLGLFGFGYNWLRRRRYAG